MTPAGRRTSLLVRSLTLFGIPLGAMLGALRATERGRRRRWVLPAAAAVLVVGLVILPIALISAPGTTSFGTLDPDQVYAAIGRSSAAGSGLVKSIAREEHGGSYAVRANVSPAIATWRMVRLEAWACDIDCLDIRAIPVKPLAVAEAQVSGGQLTASLPMRTYRNVGWYMAVLVGIDKNGERVILVSPSPENGSFVGTVIDWLRAPELGR
jgi:hypothetical protein